MSLKQTLYDNIKFYEGKEFPFSEVERICKRDGYKISNAERRLREMENIVPIYHEKGYIKGYKFIKVVKDQLCFV